MQPLEIFILLLIGAFSIAYFFRDKSKDKEKEDKWIL